MRWPIILLSINTDATEFWILQRCQSNSCCQTLSMDNHMAVAYLALSSYENPTWLLLHVWVHGLLQVLQKYPE